MIEDNTKDYYPWFKDCIGAIDGTHIPISPPDSERAVYRNRKGFLSQNVLAACNFDLQFTNLLCGWEGSVADSTLWFEAIRCQAINLPQDKYFLGDAGFPNCDACLTPYRGVRYHLQEWGKGNRAPQNKEELFNHQHSKLRNIVERIFGVLKAKYKILTRPRSFKLAAQVRVVAAICVLHNILSDINEEGHSLNIDDSYENEQEPIRVEQAYNISRSETLRANSRRDNIAEDMWAAHLIKRQRRNRL